MFSVDFRSICEWVCCGFNGEDCGSINFYSFLVGFLTVCNDWFVNNEVRTQKFWRLIYLKIEIVGFLFGCQENGEKNLFFFYIIFVFQRFFLG